ncbi:MAG: ADP-ribosylglycohydrolase family protein [Oscillospiraceae bacterium]|nr:ADP-ribosylglycohydrolase family protein [Oscillospiraceae bacterium]
MAVTLKDKFLGTIAGCHIGSAMGAAVEGMTYQQIESKHGYVDKFLPYEHYGNGWLREPGTTEDGVERQKLMIWAILEKQDRVSAEDVKQAWLKHMNPNAPGTVSEPFEGILYKMAQAGIPGKEIGRYCDYAGLNSFARSCHAIGLINAGNIETAKEDILEVGQLYQTANSRGLKWACVTGIAIAAGAAPGATVDSVIAALYDNCDPDMVVRELDRELKKTQGFTDIREMRVYFDDVYAGKGLPYAMSFANEVVTKAVCIFKMVKGNTKEAVLGGVNIGRDTDCLAAVAGGIAGALTGSASIPGEWITQLDKATTLNKNTNSQRTLAENADGLYGAFMARIGKMKAYAETMQGAE